MKSLLTLFTCLLGLFTTAQVTISGKVTDNKNLPIKGVSITIVDSYDGSTSDSLGNFSFSTTENGSKTLNATMSGYSMFNSKIDIANTPININITIKELITELNAVTITAGSFEASDKKKGTVLTSLDVVTTAGSQGEITGALKTLPGTQQVGESEGLFVPPNLDGRQHQDHRQQWQQNRRRDESQKLSADEAADNRTGRHDQHEAAVIGEDDEAAIAAVTGESDKHRRQTHRQRQASGKLNVRAE